MAKCKKCRKEEASSSRAKYCYTCKDIMIDNNSRHYKNKRKTGDILIKTLYIQGFTIHEVANKLGINSNYVYNYLRKNNLSRSISQSLKGKILSKIHKLKISEAKKGFKHPKEFGLRMSRAFKGKINIAENNGMWKGNNVGKISLHEWIKYRLKKPNVCDCCKKNQPYDLANISQKYKRDINDFEWLCRSCHMKKDGRIYNLRNQTL